MSFIFLSHHRLFSRRQFQFPLHWTASEVTLSSLALVLLSMSRTELTHSRLDFDLGMLTQNEQAWTRFQSIDSSSLNSFFFFYCFISYVQDIQLYLQIITLVFPFLLSLLVHLAASAVAPRGSDSIPNVQSMYRI